MLTEQEQRLLLERVANSKLFLQSPTLRAFLVYVAEHALAGRRTEIKEQQIGHHVLGRKLDYDTANDNIVRIRARQVRQKLDDYFANEGRDSEWIIIIPKGHYAPVFQARSQTPVLGHMEAVNVDLDPGDIKSAHVNGGARRPRLLVVLPWLMAATATLALGTILWSGRNASPLSQQPSAGSRSLWGQFFPNRGKEVTVVVADSAFALWQDFTHRNQNLGEYVTRGYLREPKDNADARGIAVRPYTSLADVILTLQISEIANLFGGKVNVKHTRNVEIHDFSSGDVVLLGSRRSDPWAELFE